jgi:hypothetical protein
MKILPVGAELLHVDGRTDRDRQTERQTDMTKLIVAFRDSANDPEDYSITRFMFSSNTIAHGCYFTPCGKVWWLYTVTGVMLLYLLYPEAVVKPSGPFVSKIRQKY